jgi:hypothetical protein
MKLSIWQQFSSNHSADFTIVGTFDSASSAEDASELIRDALRRIIDWYGQNEPVRKQVLNLARLEPTPVEQEIANQYGFKQAMILDYLANTKYNEAMVYVYQNHVFVTNARVPVGLEPGLFDQLMEKLGAAVGIEVEGADPITVNITCQVPDADLGEEIADDAATYLAHLHANFSDSPNFAITLDAGTQLSFQGLGFMQTGLDLPRFIEWLEDAGCTGFELHIEPLLWDTPPEFTENDP